MEHEIINAIEDGEDTAALDASLNYLLRKEHIDHKENSAVYCSTPHTKLKRKCSEEYLPLKKSKSERLSTSIQSTNNDIGCMEISSIERDVKSQNSNVIIKIGPYQINERSLRTLDPKAWLDDNIVGAFVLTRCKSKLIKDNYVQMTALDCTFSQSLLFHGTNKRHNDLESNKHEHVQI